MTHIIRTLAFSTAELPEQKDKLAAEFPEWEIGYKVLIDGSSWAMPRGVRWTAVSEDREVSASSADDLRRAIGKAGVTAGRS